jgi:hypothetical protein
MNIDEAVAMIGEMVHCVLWSPAGTPRDNSVCPNGYAYHQHLLIASRDVFDDPEDALCRMLISQVQRDVLGAKFIIEDLALKEKPTLYWRTMPEIEFNSNWKGKLASLYTRYVVSMQAAP